MHFEIKTKNLSNLREYKGANYGEQSAALHDGGDFPISGKLNRKEGEALEPGVYDFAPGSFGVDKHGNFVLNKVRLVKRNTAPAAK